MNQQPESTNDANVSGNTPIRRPIMITILRCLLLPTFILGWIGARYGKATILAAAGPFVIMFMGFGLSAILLAGWISTKIPSPLSIIAACVLGLSLFFSFALGALSVSDNLSIQDATSRFFSKPLLSRSAENQPNAVVRIVTALLYGAIAGAIFYFTFKILLSK